MRKHFNAEAVTNYIVDGLRQWAENTGAGNAPMVLGISGGKDSTVVAALCVRAFGPERVVGVLMPNGYQSDIDDAYAVCKFLGIDYIVSNIADAVQAEYDAFDRLKNTVTSNGYKFAPNEQVRINIPPRVRMTRLYAISQSIGGRVINTCNASENFVGYSTRWGDDTGDISLLGSLFVSEVVEIGMYLGLPENLVKKVPSDGLCGKTDEDNLGFTYGQLEDVALGRVEEVDDAIYTAVMRKHRANLFKTRMPMILDPFEGEMLD